MVLCGEATVLDVAMCIVRGLIVQSLISCVVTAVFGESAAFILKLVNIGQDTFGLIEAIESKDPDKIAVATVRLAIGILTLGCNCFTGDTIVSTEDGDRRIDEIKPGDKVWAYNTETGENELQEVKNVSVSKTDILVHVVTDDGRDIETTMFHPFYVKNEDGTGQWKAASNLETGDELLTEDGKKVFVSEVRVEKLAEEITVYNLELDEVHTYYVAGGVLVHNGCGKSNTNDSESGSSTGKYQVGAYQDIKGVEGLDAHHVGQKALMKKLVADYDELTAPAINVPKLGHTKRHPERGIVSRSTKGITNARQLLARDLFELKRVYPDIPNSTFKELIDMNKKMYPEMRK